MFIQPPNSAQAHDLVSMATELCKFGEQFNGYAAQLQMVATLPDPYVREQADAALKSLGDVMTREAVLLTGQLPDLARAEFWGGDEGERHHNTATILNLLRAHRNFTSNVLLELKTPLPSDNSLIVALDNAISATEQHLKAF
ncbi:hypothetical protein IAD21_03720 [Abditibacteriota bacterium]|nr:hypothetical protein IAD21_03720 [Abditibacteriota bacterium]